jgi:putative ABC transport system permease protein
VSAPPPRIAEWLMRQSLARGDRDAVLGDLQEEFVDRRTREGAGRARRWYRRQVARSLTYNVGHRLSWLRMRGTMQDFRHAVRSLRSTPTFTIVALVVLALGIGATTAIFSVVDGVALRGLPYWRSDRLVALTEPRVPAANHGPASAAVPAADFEDWRTEQSTFEALAAVQSAGPGFITHDGDGAQVLRVMMVSPTLFPLLRAAPVLGRGFRTDDQLHGQEHVAMLSDAFWRRRFGADPHVVGRTISVENGAWSIVGVMPPSFMYPAGVTKPVDMWIPYVPNPAELQRGDGHHISASASVVGRLKDGVSLAQARADMERITGAIKQQNPVWMRDRWVGLRPLQDTVVGNVKSWMLLLLAAVGFVLLIACVNVANLLLARATARSRDAAVRSALGASRWRIVRALLVESLVLSIGGTLLGLCLAIWGVHILRAALPASLPRLGEVGMNYRVLIAAAAASIGIAIAVTPIWQSSAPALAASLRDAGRAGTTNPRRQRARAVLLIAEVALAVVLLVGAGLFISSFVRLLRVDLGFDSTNVLSVDVSPRVVGRQWYMRPLPQAAAADLSALFERVGRIAGVEQTALVAGTPPLVGGDDRTNISVPGRPALPDSDDDRNADDKNVTAAYFSILRVPLLAGRYLNDADAAPGAPPAVLLNDVAARIFFGSDNPIGARIRIGGVDGFTVVGIVRAVRLLGPDGELRPELYRPFDVRQPLRSPEVTLLMRTAADPGQLAVTVRAAIQTAAPNLIVPAPQTYDDLFGRLVAQRKFNMIVLSLFGVLAIAIAAAGIYGVMAYVVEQRTQEIGVRIALGAEPSRVLRMVVGRAMVYMAAGLAIGLGTGWVLSRFVGAFLFKGDVHDPAVYAGAAGVLVVTGLVASFVPARRASRVDPVVALRAH